MPYYIAGEISSHEKLIARSPETFREKHNIDARIHHEVTSIDITQKKVSVTQLKTGITFTQAYDDLLIATGASPVRPPIDGINAPGIFSLNSLQSGIEVWKWLDERKPRNAVVVGGGYIGLEMAEAFLQRGLKTTLIDMATQVMVTMDADMAELIPPYMREAGVEVRLDEKLGGFETTSSGEVSAVVTDKGIIQADVVILGLGVRPNSKLAEEAGIAIGAGGAIQVNKSLETSAANVWAAGDCAESYHRVSGKQAAIALGTVANKHGVTAGTNISGGNAEFPGVLGTAITKFNDLEIARTGLSEREARELGMDVNSAIIKSKTRSGYYPGSGPITVKVTVDAVTGRLLGGQIVGMPGSGKRIDTLAMAVMAELTAFDLAFADLSYAPPFSPVWDPVQTAARQLLK
jgi:NADPH-dependent 2,4-dienoyl-CoA reductase/sulfur reductase-like enzyme